MQRIVKRTIVSSGAGRPMKVQKKSGQGTRMARDSQGNLYEVTPLANAGGSLGGMLKGAASRLSNVPRRPVALTGLVRQAYPVSPTLTNNPGLLASYSRPSTVLVARGQGGGGTSEQVEATPAPVAQEVVAPQEPAAPVTAIRGLGGTPKQMEQYLAKVPKKMAALKQAGENGAPSIYHQALDAFKGLNMSDEQAKELADNYIYNRAAYETTANVGLNSWGKDIDNYDTSVKPTLKAAGMTRIFGDRVPDINTPELANRYLTAYEDNATVRNNITPEEQRIKSVVARGSGKKKTKILSEDEVRQMIKDEIEKIKNAGCGAQKKAGSGAKKKVGCGSKKSTPANARTKKKSIR